MQQATMTMPKKRIRPIAALKAVRALLRDPEDTRQVFLITEALNGNAGMRSFERFRKSEAGKRILAEKRVLLTYLCDRERLASLPEGTLGRAYSKFMEHEGLTADGLVEASLSENRDPMPPDVRLFAERGRDWHDLHHVLAGYGRDGLGEVCVLTQLSAQSWNPGLLLIVIAGLFKIKQEVPGQPIARAVWEAWRNGRKAAWLGGLDWEGLLDQPLDRVRPMLNIGKPALYRRIIDAVFKPEAATGDGVASAIAAE